MAGSELRFAARCAYGRSEVAVSCLFFAFCYCLAIRHRSALFSERALGSAERAVARGPRTNLKRASKLDPDNPYAWTSLAETYYRLKESQRALAAAKSAEKVGSQDPIVSHALAMFYSESGDIGTAARLEARFAESPKSDSEATARAASLYLEAGDTQAAISLARKSALRQSSAAHEDLLGRALVASGQTTEGMEHYRKAAQLAPTDAKIAFDYAQALLRKEDFGAAADALGSALAAHPDDAQLVLAMGVARYGQRRFEDCAVLLLRVIKLDPNIEQPYAFLGKMMDQAHSYLPEITDAFRTWTNRRAPETPRQDFYWLKQYLLQEATTRRLRLCCVDLSRSTMGVGSHTMSSECLR